MGMERSLRQGCPHLRFVPETCLYRDNNLFTWWLRSPNPCVSCPHVCSSQNLLCSFWLYYPCLRPVRVVSSAAQAAAVVPQVRRHGEMFKLINRRQYCLNKSYIVFCCRLTRTNDYGLVVKVIHSESGDLGSIPAWCWNSLPPLGPFSWKWDRHCCTLPDISFAVIIMMSEIHPTDCKRLLAWSVFDEVFMKPFLN